MAGPYTATHAPAVLAALPGTVVTVAAATGLPARVVRVVLEHLYDRGLLRFSLATGTYSPRESR